MIEASRIEGAGVGIVLMTPAILRRLPAEGVAHLTSQLTASAMAAFRAGHFV